MTRHSVDNVTENRCSTTAWLLIGILDLFSISTVIDYYDSSYLSHCTASQALPQHNTCKARSSAAPTAAMPVGQITAALSGKKSTLIEKIDKVPSCWWPKAPCAAASREQSKAKGCAVLSSN
jgi:hypothetical protein